MSAIYNFDEEQLLETIRLCEDDLSASNIRKKIKLTAQEANALHRAVTKYITKYKRQAQVPVNFYVQLEYANHLGFVNVSDAYAKYEPREFRIAAKEWFDMKYTRRLKKTISTNASKTYNTNTNNNINTTSQVDSKQVVTTQKESYAKSDDSYDKTSADILDNIKQWSTDRNMYSFADGISPISQTFKVIEELGELYAGILRNNDEQIKDGIGDTQIASFNLRQIFDKFKFSQNSNLTAAEHTMLLALHNMGELATSILLRREDNFTLSLDRFLSLIDTISMSKNYEQYECMEAAYNVIKTRQGKMINRNFVKAEDLHK